MSNIQAKAPAVLDILSKSKDQIRAALPAHLKPERMMRIALTEIRKTPNLQRCDPMSVIAGIIQSSQLGLEIGSGLGQAYLIPFKRDCQLIIGYQGMIDVAYRSGKVKDIRAYVVKKDDYFKFSVTQDGEKLTFEPSMDSGMDEATAENTVCVLAQATLTTGGTISKIVSTAEIEKTRNFSRSKNVWNNNWEAMALKTAIRRLYKMLPKSVEMQHVERLENNGGVIEREEQVEIIPQKLLSVIPQNSDTDELYDRLTAKFVDLCGSAVEVLGDEEYQKLQPMLKDETVDDLVKSIEILQTKIADKKGG